MAPKHQPLTFSVVDSHTKLIEHSNTAFLIEDGWDDWFTYSTMYTLIVFDSTGKRHRIGSVKIGEFNMAHGQRRPNLPKQFALLDESFFSLGQDADFYESLNQVGDLLRECVLRALRDFAFDLDIWKRAILEDVTRISLTRGISKTEIEGQFRRIACGGARLTPYHFTYSAPKRTNQGLDEVKLEFSVEPESFPPTNIHVLIGRNGVGKTHTLNLMVKALVGKRASASQSGHFTTIAGNGVKLDSPFSNLVSVCFSAFDSFQLDPDELGTDRGIEYSYVGLRRPNQGPMARSPKSPEMLAKEFVRSASECGYGGRAKRWRAALETLETDPIFKAANITEFIGRLSESDNNEASEEAKSVFKKLSSGHQIVLLTITCLVEAVEERSLVLLDEPEGHLHPPLLAAFIRALSKLLREIRWVF